MKTLRWWLLAAAVMSGCASTTDDKTAAVRKELAPTGKLRVGIAVGTIASAYFAVKDPSTGRPRGVTVDLATELSKRLGVPLELVVYPSIAAHNQSATSGEWDVTFMPVDRDRAKLVDFGPAYVLFESTYLVAPSSAIRAIEDVDRPGVRVVAQKGSSQALYLGQSLTQATLVQVATVEAGYSMLRDGKADAVASARPRLTTLAAGFPGARVLDGSFTSTGIAIAVPKSRPAALEYVTAFIENAKSSGTVGRALNDAGLKGITIAPATVRP